MLSHAVDMIYPFIPLFLLKISSFELIIQIFKLILISYHL